MFEIGDKVTFGQRLPRATKKNKTIPRFEGHVTRISRDFGTQVIVWVQSPEVQYMDIPFTLRKNGNWVRMKDHDDPYPHGSRMALRLATVESK